ncbi:MAG: hypothetical protein Q4A42_01980 [Tissierellia bacterium]|nr:hypothetical protein [Tissierellia bacterium]
MIQRSIRNCNVKEESIYDNGGLNDNHSAGNKALEIQELTVDENMKVCNVRKNLTKFDDIYFSTGKLISLHDHIYAYAKNEKNQYYIFKFSKDNLKLESKIFLYESKDNENYDKYINKSESKYCMIAYDLNGNEKDRFYYTPSKTQSKNLIGLYPHAFIKIR